MRGVGFAVRSRLATRARVVDGHSKDLAKESSCEAAAERVRDDAMLEQLEGVRVRETRAVRAGCGALRRASMRQARCGMWRGGSRRMRTRRAGRMSRRSRRRITLRGSRVLWLRVRLLVRRLSVPLAPRSRRRGRMAEHVRNQVASSSLLRDLVRCLAR